MTERQRITITLCDTNGLVDIEVLNRGRWLASREPYVGEQFICTGSQHVGSDVLLVCDSSYHRSDWLFVADKHDGPCLSTGQFDAGLCNRCRSDGLTLYNP